MCRLIAPPPRRLRHSLVRSVACRERSDARLRTLALMTLLAAAALMLTAAPASADAMGTACIEDGDTLSIDGRRAYGACRGGTPVQLYGIDAPELEQTCEHQGQSWACGREAASTLLRLTLRKTVTCLGNSVDREGRLVAVCKVGGVDLNETMVRLGMAVSDGTRYARQEGDARATKTGMWMGPFDRPAHWRAAQ